MHEECDDDLNQEEQETYDDAYPGTDDEDEGDTLEMKQRKAQQKQFEDQRLRAAAPRRLRKSCPSTQRSGRL